MIHGHALIIQYEKQNQTVQQKHVNLLYYEKRRLLNVSATYCGQIQGGVLRRIYCTERQSNFIYKYVTLRFK